MNGRWNLWRVATVVSILTALGVVSLVFFTQMTGGRKIVSRHADAKLLLWQAALDRRPIHFLPIEVNKIKADKGGLFGIRQSPSLVGSFPDPQIIEGRILKESGDRVQVRMPGMELPSGVERGQRLVLGLVDDTHVICLLRPSSGLSDRALVQWALEQRCD